MRQRVSTTVRHRTLFGSTSTTYVHRPRQSRHLIRRAAVGSVRVGTAVGAVGVAGTVGTVGTVRWLSRLEWTWQRVALVVGVLALTGIPGVPAAVGLPVWLLAFFAWRRLGPRPVPAPMPTPLPGPSWCDFCADWTTHPSEQHPQG